MAPCAPPKSSENGESTQSSRPLDAPDSAAASSANSCRGLGAAAVCRTTLVTTSETSRQARSAWSSSMPHSTNVSKAIFLASDTLIGSASKRMSQCLKFLRRRPDHQDRHVVVDLARHGVLGGLGDLLDALRGDRPDRLAEHPEHLGVLVMPRAVGAMAPVDQSVGVEDQRGPGGQLAGFLAVGRQAGEHAADAEQDALMLDLELAHVLAGDDHRRVVTSVGDRQLPEPRIVDQVRAAGGRRIGALVLPLVGHRPAPVVQPAQDVGGRLVVLRERPQSRAELAHDGRRPRAASLDVADHDAYPAGGQLDDVVPVPADLCLDSLPVALQRLGRDVPVGHLEPVEYGRLVRQQAVLERQRGGPLLLEQQRVVDRDRDPARDGRDQVPVVGHVVPWCRVRSGRTARESSRRVPGRA